MAKLALGNREEAAHPDCLRAVLAEVVLTFLFVFAGVASAMAAGKMSGGADSIMGLTAVALTHGLVVALNPSSLACLLLRFLTGGLDTPVHTLAAGMGPLQGVIMEIVLTFSLLFSVYGTIVDPKKGCTAGLGPLLVGLVVAGNIIAGGAFSGASMNPARSFGPALVSWNWTDHWVYWIGPLIGGAFGGLVYDYVFLLKSHTPLPREDEPF
ncbi:hypothetical protein J5N97_004426 [Dioscorea zingiberensis]|uniref:Uncharacterized protein n=1 Tax=Dioscorea zingiberensis TaxID=325984 RepID=A0A9D5HQY4_9LILI|nr:hypothetical protein J5N97_004426 [Dioscorea zingiberensis]